ncbi:MAG: Hsp70 family protein, partial [Oscillospiraceae bacterium]|nr:Hsp70 family protein [Oscillospiraceae bacterium]
MLLFNKIRRKIERFMKDIEKGTDFIDKVLLVGGTLNIPYIQNYLKDYFGADKVCCENDLSKLVAEGAAMMAAQDGTLLKIQVEDVLSYDLGIAAKSHSGENIFSVIIPKSTKYPVAITKKYSTAKDNQETIPIDVYEGDSRRIEDNHKYGRVTLSDFPKGPAGLPVMVEFSIDEDKILNVKVVEQKSGKYKTEKIMLGYEAAK